MSNSTLLRTKGDQARDRQAWSTAGYYYAKFLALHPDDAGLWLQQGHALKEVAMLAKAKFAYNQAANLNPNDPEPYVQLAILAKLQGNFDLARAHFEKAAELGYGSPGFLEGELTFLRKTSGEPRTVARRTQADYKVFLSSCSPIPAEHDTGRLKGFLGGTNYSYAYAMKGFKEALERSGYLCEVIDNPEYVADVRQTSSVRHNIHLGFFPPDGPRYLKGAYNVLCIAWEFERLKTRQESLSYHSFADPVQMLAMAGEIWTTSTYGEEAFRRSGLQNVFTVPTPVLTSRQRGRARPPTMDEQHQLAFKLDRVNWVPLAIWPAMQSSLSEQSAARSRPLLSHMIEFDRNDAAPVFFTSVFNIHDFRKQIRPLIEGFSYFARKHQNAFLLLKISAIDGTNHDVNETLFYTQVNEDGDIIPPLVSNNVLISTDVLSREEMEHLYDISSFYICTPHAEGQNLPLLEAIGRGVVPISVDHTAMREYISPQDAIVIPSDYRQMRPRLASRYGLFGVGTYFVDGPSVSQALDQALALTEPEYECLSNEAVRTLVSKFGLEPFTRKIENLIERLNVAKDG